MIRTAHRVTLMAGGDVGPLFAPTESLADLISPVLQQADLRFAQCERTYSHRGRLTEAIHGSGWHSRLDPSLAAIWTAARIDVVSLASNHTMDWGAEPLLDTIDMFRSMGKSVIGAGASAEEARKPAIVERNGIKTAFLAYCSAFRDGDAAGPQSAGIAPMRAHTYYAPGDPHPGNPPTIITVPYDKDMQALQDDVRRAKELADAVIVSMHWGISLVPKTICDYQPPMAHAAIDAGADLILGHHPHCIKAVEVYKGKVCFYSIGNFMNPGPVMKSRERLRWNLNWFQIEQECMPPSGMYFFPSHCRMTMVVKAAISKQGVERVAFLPAFISRQGQPFVVAEDDPKFREILDYTEWVSEQYPHRFRVDGGEVVVDTTA